MGEDNVVHGVTSSEGLVLHQNQAPPRYGDHCLDRLYQGLPLDHYETPMHTPLSSRPNSPNLSRQNSSENLVTYSGGDPGRSGSYTPPRVPGHRNTSSTSPSLLSPASPSRTMAEEVAARLSQCGNEDYFSRPVESIGHIARHSGPSTGAHSPDELREGGVDLGALSKVPSYSTAIRSGTRNLSSASNLPTYHNGFYSAPTSLTTSPRGSPPSPPLMPIMHSLLQRRKRQTDVEGSSR